MLCLTLDEANNIGYATLSNTVFSFSLDHAIDLAVITSTSVVGDIKMFTSLSVYSGGVIGTTSNVNVFQERALGTLSLIVFFDQNLNELFSYSVSTHIYSATVIGDYIYFCCSDGIRFVNLLDHLLMVNSLNFNIPGQIMQLVATSDGFLIWGQDKSDNFILEVYNGLNLIIVRF